MSGDGLDVEPCASCGNPVDRNLPNPIPDGYECTWSEAMCGRALYCQSCFDEIELEETK